MHMNLTSDWWIVWELRIALGLWIAVHGLPFVRQLLGR